MVGDQLNWRPEPTLERIVQAGTRRDDLAARRLGRDWSFAGTNDQIPKQDQLSMLLVDSGPSHL
jgi:hypothetical protein